MTLVTTTTPAGDRVLLHSTALQQPSLLYLRIDLHGEEEAEVGVSGDRVQLLLQLD